MVIIGSHRLEMPCVTYTMKIAKTKRMTIVDLLVCGYPVTCCLMYNVMYMYEVNRGELWPVAKVSSSIGRSP